MVLLGLTHVFYFTISSSTVLIDCTKYSGYDTHVFTWFFYEESGACGSSNVPVTESSLSFTNLKRWAISGKMISILSLPLEFTKSKHIISTHLDAIVNRFYHLRGNIWWSSYRYIRGYFDLIFLTDEDGGYSCWSSLPSFHSLPYGIIPSVSFITEWLNPLVPSNILL